MNLFKNSEEFNEFQSFYNGIRSYTGGLVGPLTYIFGTNSEIEKAAKNSTTNDWAFFDGVMLILEGTSVPYLENALHISKAVVGVDILLRFYNASDSGVNDRLGAGIIGSSRYLLGELTKNHNRK
ncbi:Uncharacterised protein [uncultured archaeon]|nr:Uncharacterised protein [uncultured archaeon]